MSSNHDLADLGWNSFFAAQLGGDDLKNLSPARVIAAHRDRLDVAGAAFAASIPFFRESDDDDESVATVGDWLLLDVVSPRATRLLRRLSLFKRRAAGRERSKLQLIAANVDTLFIVSSCNQDFNLARLERYLALARAADVAPIVVLTKADLAGDASDFVRAAAKLLPGLLVETIDARERDSAACLAPWCARGQTVALVGSSGVGKSTLVNTLTGEEGAATQAARDDDDRGRHTTTTRRLHRMPAGGWLLDTPGMRELQLADADEGVEDVFADIVALARQCRFNNCRHDDEPGCAVGPAIESGALDAARLKRWRKLAAEDAHASQNIAERRARSRAFGKTARRAMRDKQSLRDE